MEFHKLAVSSNTSQRRAQAIVLRSKVDEYRTWRLTVDCGACGPRVLPMGDLPSDVTVFRLVQLMRCRSCGGRVVTAAIDNGRDGSANRRVRIWGPGASGRGPCVTTVLRAYYADIPPTGFAPVDKAGSLYKGPAFSV